MWCEDRFVAGGVVFVMPPVAVLGGEAATGLHAPHGTVPRSLAHCSPLSSHSWDRPPILILIIGHFTLCIATYWCACEHTRASRLGAAAVQSL